jgi:hypothetical protein
MHPNSLVIHPKPSHKTILSFFCPTDLYSPCLHGMVLGTTLPLLICYFAINLITLHNIRVKSTYLLISRLIDHECEVKLLNLSSELHSITFQNTVILIPWYSLNTHFHENFKSQVLIWSLLFFIDTNHHYFTCQAGWHIVGLHKLLRQYA